METKNRTAKEQLDEWDRILDEYEKSIGLGSYKSDLFPEDEINLYFSMNRDHIEKLNPEDCLQIAYRLGQFALHVQRSTNREIARHNWADETIKEVIADEINNYKGYGFLEKSLQAIKHNNKAESLNKIKKYAKQRSDRLSYLSGNIKNLSDILMMVYRSKSNSRSQ
jgi:hypothetical protein